MRHRRYLIPGRLATFAFWNGNPIQSYNGLYSIEPVVYRENILPDLRDHVVPVDFSKVENRSASEPGMEVLVAHKYGQPFVGYPDCYHGMAFLSSTRDS
jgi:hypothetical protein